MDSATRRPLGLAVLVGLARPPLAAARASGDTIRDTAEEVVPGLVPGLGGGSGVIGMDALGDMSIPFDGPARCRGEVDPAGRPTVAISRDE